MGIPQRLDQSITLAAIVHKPQRRKHAGRYWLGIHLFFAAFNSRRGHRLPTKCQRQNYRYHLLTQQPDGLAYST